MEISSPAGTSGAVSTSLDRDKDHPNLGTASRIEALTSPTALRKVVLNYLLHHCYIDTAHAFARDGGEAPATLDPAASSDSSHLHLHPNLVAGIVGAGQNGSSSSSGGAVPSGSTSRGGSVVAGPAMSSSSSSRSMHPLAAPPLSRHDSSMEVEGDHLLATASSSSALGRARTTGRSGSGTELDIGAASIEEDAEMGEVGPPHEERGVGSATQDVQDGYGQPRRDADAGGFEDTELTVEDLQSVRLRQEIRDHILTGRIRHATEVLNTHFPAVLGSDVRPDYGRKSSNRSSKGSGSQYSIPSGPTSLEPEHLALNLQIQAFIESVRSANSPTNGLSGSSMIMSQASLTSNGHGSSSREAVGLRAVSPSPHSLAQFAPGIAAATVSRSSSPAPSSVSSASSSASGPSSGVPTALQTALSNAQLLYASVQRLKNGPYKELYRKELESVTAILAYKDLERSPLKKYLDGKRRKSLADQINSAIMFRSGRPSQPLIESAVRQTTFVWSQLHNEHIAIPQDHPALQQRTGVGCRTGRAAGVQTGLGARRGDEKWSQEGANADKKGKTKVPSTFYLPAFLAER